MPPKKKTAIKKALLENTDTKGTLWQWYDWNGDKDWIDFHQADSAVFEARFQAAGSDTAALKFQLTTELSFNKKHKTKYTFDLGGPKQRTQMNEESGTVRNLRRLVEGVECYKLPAEPKKRDRDSDDDASSDDSREAPVNGGTLSGTSKKEKEKGEHSEEEEDGDVTYRVGKKCKSPFWDPEDSDGTLPGPVTDEMVKATEKLLGGKKLPESYIKLLQSTGQNGGPTNKRHIPEKDKETGNVVEGYEYEEEGYMNLGVMFGIAGDDATQGLAGAWTEFVEDREGFPDIGVYFATESEGECAWVMDYRKCGQKGEPSVVYINLECEETEVHIADSFQTFLEMLAEPVA